MNCIFRQKHICSVVDCAEEVLKLKLRSGHVATYSVVFECSQWKWASRCWYVRSCIECEYKWTLDGANKQRSADYYQRKTKRRVSHRVTANKLQQQQQQQQQRAQNICLHRCGKVNNYENAFTSHQLGNSFTNHPKWLAKNADSPSGCCSQKSIYVDGWALRSRHCYHNEQCYRPKWQLPNVSERRGAVDSVNIMTTEVP